MIRGRRLCDPTSGCGKHYKQHLKVCPYCKTSDTFSDLIPYNPLHWVYDLESYPNIFTASFKHPNTNVRARFEISSRRNDLEKLITFLYSLKHNGCYLIGFNNVGYDYPLLHFIIENSYLGLQASDIYYKSSTFIATPWMRRWANIIWDSDTHIKQIDLSKIHHFDNDNRRTSLKILEFNMRMESVEDLPFLPGKPLALHQMPILVSYNDHDVDATTDFYIASIEMIEFREQLSEKYKINFLNHSDKKIGTDLFINELEKNSPGSCYSYDTGHKKVRQTIRTQIALADIIFPYIQFKNPEFERIKQWYLSQVVTETRDSIANTAIIDGFEYHCKLGGIHGSIDSTIVYSNNDYIITDWDVGGYYPEVGTVNKLYPEHLSDYFCVVNENLKQERKKYKKGTALNNSIKLARNGAFGDSNNKYSPFLDAQYMLSITVNGQLLLCMLAQYLIDIPGLEMIQVNTDGLTVRCPRQHVDQMNHICKWWEEYTCLELESATYSRMFIRDVNNYIAEYENGKLKSKGAYVHKTKESQGSIWTPNDMDWNQDFSALIIPMAAEAALVRGECIETFIKSHSNILDFMLRTKINKTDQLVMTDIFGKETLLQNVTRYYVSTALDAGVLKKISPPAKGHKVGQWKRATKLTDDFYNSVIAELSDMTGSSLYLPHELDTTGRSWDERINTKNKSKYKIRNTGLEVGYLVTPCNNMKGITKFDINFDYYIREVEKLVKPLL